ncbi:complement component C9 [Protopterus annectens]|uniref:complement component C9 n=1 Tax=Protopterus annectens TaxID=7888 RepID=UPI001CFBDABA|nr:complement component C9 [Protopterus annectens]
MKLVSSSIRCILTFILLETVSSASVNPDGHDDVLKRPVREANSPPPIECKWTSWSDWSECYPCTKEKYRSRSIVNFGQFGGNPCHLSLGQTASCRPTQPCVEDVVDCGNDFTCETGRCIRKRLECNGDNDCGDFSDENCDEVKRQPCPHFMELSEIARTAGSGLNILGMQSMAVAFDNEFYNGVCNRVRDVNSRTYYRIPWNVMNIVYQTKAQESFSTEIYEDTSVLITEVFSEKTSSFGLDLSFKLTHTEENAKQDIDTSKGQKSNSSEVNASLQLRANSSEVLRNLKHYSFEKNKIFMRVKGSIQLGRFQMRTRDAVFIPSFIDELKALPKQYEKGEYFRFLEAYGTHYSVSGEVGGTYQLIYVFNKDNMKHKEETLEEIKKCFGYDAKINIAESTVDASIKSHSDTCKRMRTEGAAAANRSRILDNVLTLIDGGTVEFAAKLKGKLEKKEPIDSEVYYEWAKSLQDAPVLIKQKTNPISSLVPIHMKDAQEKKENIERAIDDYISEHNVCKCQPCQNGGTVVLIDGECICNCPDEYEGIACQNSKGIGSEKISQPAVINGGWSCWSAWSECKGGSRVQIRTCNNPTAGPGGQKCQGDSTNLKNC